MMRPRALPVLLLVGVVLAGCGGGDDAEVASPAPSEAPASESAVPVEPSETAAAEGGACGEAFAAADPDGDGKTTFSMLVPAYTACESHDEWVATSQDYALTASTNDGQGAVPLAEVPAVRCPFAVEVGNREATSPVCTSLPG